MKTTLSDLLDDMRKHLKRFVAYPCNHAAVAHALWCAHTHAMGAWESTPRLAFLSPEPGSGKTRALELTGNLVPRPVEAINVTLAYLIRKIDEDKGLPTILFDEIDAVFGPKARDNEELRSLLNAGHRRGAIAGRCVKVGNKIETQDFPAYAPVALAGLGNLPDTILSRAIVVRMRRRAPQEDVEPYRTREHAPLGLSIRDKLADALGSQEEFLRNSRPNFPRGIADRDADVWEPLLAIADHAGGGWPQLARAAAVALVTDAKRKSPSLTVRLLEDIRTAFGEAGKLSTTDLLASLNAMEEAPWGALKGRPLDPRRLASMLSDYGISPGHMRVFEVQVRGYYRPDFEDAWNRYLRPHPTRAA